MNELFIQLLLCDGKIGNIFVNRISTHLNISYPLNSSNILLVTAILLPLLLSLYNNSSFKLFLWIIYFQLRLIHLSQILKI